MAAAESLVGHIPAGSPAQAPAAATAVAHTPADTLDTPALAAWQVWIDTLVVIDPAAVPVAVVDLVVVAENMARTRLRS